MDENKASEPNGWSEETSRLFVNYGEYVVPHRQMQMQIISSLLADLQDDGQIIDICCGEGLLDEILLGSKSGSIVYGLDGSEEMLRRATDRLSRFGNRFVTRKIDISDRSWRSWSEPVDAVVSSLAIHHLEGLQKLELFRDVYEMLKPDGRIVIADIIDPTGKQGKLLAADLWDKIVKQRSLELDGKPDAYEFFKREGWNIFRYLDPEDIDKPSPLYHQLRWLEEAGFTEIDVNWMLAGHAIFSARKPY